MVRQQVPEDWIGQEVIFPIVGNLPSHFAGTLERIETGSIGVGYRMRMSIRSQVKGTSEWINEGETLSEPRHRFFAWDEIGPVELRDA